jgi:hypothetical protein
LHPARLRLHLHRYTINQNPFTSKNRSAVSSENDFGTDMDGRFAACASATDWNSLRRAWLELSTRQERKRFRAKLDNRIPWLGMTAAEAFDVLDVG